MVPGFSWKNNFVTIIPERSIEYRRYSNRAIRILSNDKETFILKNGIMWKLNLK